MSRNAGGTYSLPAGNPVVTGTSISSTAMNDTMNDLKTELTDSLSRSNKGAMLAQLQAYAGTVSVPGLSWASDTDTGLYYISPGVIGFAVGGVKSLELSSGAINISAVTPSLFLTETDAPVNETKWAFDCSAGDLRLVAWNDAVSSGSVPMTIARTATTIDSITFAGTTIAITGNETVSGTLNVTGAATFSSAKITGAIAQLTLNESDAGVDEKEWHLRASGGDFFLYTATDAGSAAGTPLAITRTATTVDSITFNGTLITLSGNGTVSGTLGVTGNFSVNTNKFTVTAGSGNTLVAGTLAVTGDVAVNTNKFTVAASSGDTLVAGTLTVGAIDATPTTGSFTINLRATVGGANIASGTAYWHKMNGVVTLYIPALSTVSTDANLYVEDLPAAIQTSRTQKIPCVGYLNGPQAFVLATVQGGNDYIRISPPDGGSFSGSSSERGVNGTTIVYQVA